MSGGESPDCTPFSEDPFRQTRSIRERDEEARARTLDDAAARGAFDSMPEDQLHWECRNGVYFVVDRSLAPGPQPEWQDLPYLVHALRNRRCMGETIPEAEIPRELRQVAERIDGGRDE